MSSGSECDQDETGDPCCSRGFSDNKPDPRIEELQWQLQLLTGKQARIEELHARFRCGDAGLPSTGVRVSENKFSSPIITVEGLAREIDNLNIRIDQILRDNRKGGNPEIPRSCEGTPSGRPELPTASTAFHVTLRDAIETVPFFNGKTPPLLQFARACKRAREMVPPEAEPQLTRLIRGRLEGHAYYAVEDRVFDNLDNLIHRLKTVFAPAKTADHYRGELANVMKGNREDILDYITRVRDLGSAILDSEAYLYANFNDATRNTNMLTLRSFVDGLPPPFRTQLQMNGYGSLEDAFDKAIKINAQIKRDEERFSDRRQNILSCQLCGREGHDAQGCRLLPRPPPPLMNRPVKPPYIPRTHPINSWPTQPSSRPAPPLLPRTCTYCGRTGHVISECRTKNVMLEFNRRETISPCELQWTRLASWAQRHRVQ